MTTLNVTNLKNPSSASNNIVLDAAGGATFQQIKGGALTLATAVASTSGTSIDFTGIPSWVKRVTVMFDGVSTNGTSFWLARVGTSGGIQATGYAGSCGSTTVASFETTAAMINRNVGSAESYHGHCILTQISANTWVFSGLMQSGVSYARSQFASSVTLSGTLDRIRITTANGTDTFDAGTINIMYEG